MNDKKVLFVPLAIDQLPDQFHAALKFRELLAFCLGFLTVFFGVTGISELGDLEENWNSYGGRPVDPQCAVKTIIFLLSMLDADTPMPIIVPTNRGGIQLEWHRSGVDLEIEIESISRLHVFFADEESGEESEVTLTSNLQPVVPLLDRLIAR